LLIGSKTESKAVAKNDKDREETAAKTEDVQVNQNHRLGYSTHFAVQTNKY
jgi:hypothetical protein